MEIIFIRHEAAEEAHAGLPDLERRLSQAGQVKAQEAVPQLVEYLKEAALKEVTLKEEAVGSNKPAILVWTSPALRAQETAQPYIEALGASVEVHDFLYTGEFEQLTAALESLPQSVETLVLFGHEPILSGWIKKLTDETVKMKKGDRASVTLHSSLKGDYQGKL